MAHLFTKVMQPTERLPIDITFVDIIDGRPFTDISVDVDTPAGMTLGNQEVFDSTLQLYVSGGADGTAYNWTITTEITVVGQVNQYEDDFTIVVSNAPGFQDVEFDAAARPAGSAPPKIKKRIADDRTYLIDCTDILTAPHEYIVSVTSATGEGLSTCSAAMARAGTALALHVAGGPEPATSRATYADVDVRVLMTTTQGTIETAITVRVYP